MSTNKAINCIISERLIDMLHERPSMTFGQLLVAANIAKRVGKGEATIDLNLSSEEMLARLVAATGGT